MNNLNDILVFIKNLSVNTFGSYGLELIPVNKQTKNQTMQKNDFSDLLNIKLYNIVDMGLTFSAMIRLYEKGTKKTLRNKILEELDNISKVPSNEAFNKIHFDFCRWGINNIFLAEKIKAGMIIKKRKPASYGQIAKTLDVVLTVVVHYCQWPNHEKSKEMSQWLNAAVDTKMMKLLKKSYPENFNRWPSSVEDVDENTYLDLQKLVHRFIQDEHDGDIIPVQFGDYYWNLLNR